MAKKTQNTTILKTPKTEETQPERMETTQYPAHWQVKTVKELSSKIQYGYTGKTQEKGKFFYLRITDIQAGKVDWPTVPFCDIEENDAAKYILEKGNILFARSGATSGKTYLFEDTQKSIFASYLIRVCPIEKLVQAKYLYMFFQSPSYWQQIQEKVTGAAQPNVNGQKLAEIVLPLPSIEEQKQIVEKLDALFERIDKAIKLLDENIKAADELFASALNNVFSYPLAPLEGGTQEQNTAFSCEESEKMRDNAALSLLSKGNQKRANLEALHETGVFQYNTKLLEQAEEMRKNPTPAEKKLWDEVLRSSKTGFKFTRQKPIDNFILDFYCSELLLGIEVDGEIHKEQIEKDEERTNRLNQFGIKIIRFTNQQVLNDLEKVQKIISETINHSNRSSSPFQGGWGVKNWQVKKLGEVCEVITGSTPPKSNPILYGDFAPFFKPADLNSGINTKNAQEWLSQEGLSRCRRLPINSVLVTCIGATIGKTGLIKKEGACNQQINAIKPTKELIPEYIYFYCISSNFQKQIIQNASTATLPIINKSKFESLIFLIPSLEEQKEIVAYLDSLCERQKKLKNSYLLKRDELKALKASLLDVAFKGQLVGHHVQ